MSLDDSIEKILEILIDTNSYQSPYAKVVGDPEPILTPLIRKRAILTSLVAGTSNFIPSYFGYMVSLVEVFTILKIQARLVKDIAIIFGKEKDLNKDLLLYCLFKNSHPELGSGLIKFLGSRLLFRPTSYSTFCRIIKQINFQKGFKLESRLFKNLFFIFGSIALSSLAYFDTKIVGHTAIQIFSKEIIFEES